ncbi:hypothetical protein CG478_013265 [Bacillus cytotoxicus]|uniref:hypothetical protein n=1 Tax=Bacillus cytotoxicus TaxID=580165 RepID=UPI000B96415B|nr:hypothetical protein [Bacillus cytotoxicus]AWC41324.1 hypothetical protein CG480_013265 [Bacillus cytotoxicus]AWC49255.1 hypothetical protein CG478_013265 [Bacillus cytotoxicus]
MNWIKKVSVNPLNEKSFEMSPANSNDELRIQSVHLEREDNNISILAQLFMANHILVRCANFIICYTYHKPPNK